MSRLIFALQAAFRATAPGAFGALVGLAAAAASPSPAAAQWVPGRDLLDFPIGTLAEAPALATQARIGLWNPAAIVVRDVERGRFGVAALTTPADQGVSAQLAGAALRLAGGLNVAISVVRAAVGDLLVTDQDPLSLGEVRYSTTLVSAMVARRNGDHVATGLAVRYRGGQLGGMSRGAVALDGGVMVDRLGPRDGRLAASTFLWSPANQEEERATFTGAADLRIAGHEPTHEARAGYSFAATQGGVREHYAFLGARSGIWEGRGGLARTAAFDAARWRLRLAVGVYYARYAVAVGREENGAGLPATYQFSLSSTVR